MEGTGDEPAGWPMRIPSLAEGRHRGIPSVDGGTIDADGRYSKADILEHYRMITQSLAKFAFSMFWRAMRLCRGTAGPILLDY